MVMTHRNNRRRRHAAGFTMIELLIAITILAVGMLAVASMQVAALQTNAKASRYTEASNLAQDRMERFIAMAYNDANLVDGSETLSGMYEFVKWRVDWTVTEIDLNADTVNDAKQIVVRSSFTEPGSPLTRNVTLQFTKPRI